MNTQRILLISGLVILAIAVGVAITERLNNGGSSTRDATDSLLEDLCKINPDHPDCL